MADSEIFVKTVVGVKFRKQGRIYHFDSAGIKLKKNDCVLVNTENGPAIGMVMKEAMHLISDNLPAELKTVIRKLTDEDKLAERRSGAPRAKRMISAWRESWRGISR